MSKVLIVDDEPMICSLLEMHYRSEGFETHCAHNGDEAFRVYGQQKPDLVITDVKMPERNGEKFIEDLSGLVDSKPVIICMTAYSDLSAEKAFEMGVDAIFKKPFQVKDLMGASRRFLNMKKELNALNDFKKKQESGLKDDCKLQLLAELSSGVAHNINNHIACISAASSIIESQLGSLKEGVPLTAEDLERLKKYFGKIFDHAMMTSRIIKSMRMLSKSNEDVKLENVSVASIVHSAIDLIEEFCSKNNIKITNNVEENIYIQAQPEKSLQIFLNLLQNSCEAVCELGERWISIDTQKNSDGVQVIFTDSGRGISPDVRERIMQPFYTTKKDGNGVGLSLSQKMMDAQGGRLWLDAECPHTRFIAEFKC